MGGPGLMAVSVLCYSVSPLVVAVAGASASPFLFVSLMLLGGLSGYLTLLALRYRDLLRGDPGRTVLRAFLRCRGIRPVLLLAQLASGLDYAVFVLSTRFVDVAVSASLYETWPLFGVPMTVLLGRGRYRSPGWGGMALLAAGFAGAALVVLSQEGRVPGVGSVRLATGVGLALLSAFLVSLAAGLFRWSAELAREMPPSGRGRLDLEFFAVSVGVAVTDVFSVLLNGGVGLATGEGLGWTLAAAGLALGFLVYFASGAAWRAANLVSRDPAALNALGYFTPLAVLGWLWGYSAVGLPGGGGVLVVASPGLLAAGVVLVTASNAAGQFSGRVSRRPGSGG